MPENLQEMPIDPSTGAAAIVAPPVSPAQAPISDPSMIGGQSQVNPEQEAGMRFELERMLGKIENKNTAFEEKQALSSEKLEGLKAEILKRIFGLMKDLGVDPSDLSSINEFLQKLQQQDPDLYVMFESAINSLSSEGAPAGMAPAGMAPAGMAPAGMAPAPGIAGMETAPNSMQALGSEGAGLMDGLTTNLQENILRQ